MNTMKITNTWIYYGRDRNRELVRKRDSYTCQKCHKIWQEGTRRFDVHHLNGLCGKKSIDYDRLSELESLTTLCHKCHMGLSSVREKISNKERNTGKHWRRNRMLEIQKTA